MATEHKIKSIEDLGKLNISLSHEDVETLIEKKHQGVICWTNSQGWPVGMPHSVIWSDQKFWIWTAADRARIKALAKRPQSCVTVTSDGTDFGSAMVAVKTLATVHYGRRDLIDWIIPKFFDQTGMPSDPESRKQQIELMDTPGRVVVEFEPVQYLTYDGRKLQQRLREDGWDRWGSSS